MKLSKLAYIGFYLNSALETGKYNKVSIKATKRAIEKGKLFQFLERKLGDYADFSIYDKSDRKIINEVFSKLLDMEEQRHFGVNKNGLHLLIAYILELVQHKKSYLS